jgi:hypothetical protein
MFFIVSASDGEIEERFITESVPVLSASFIPTQNTHSLTLMSHKTSCATARDQLAFWDVDRSH